MMAARMTIQRETKEQNRFISPAACAAKKNIQLVIVSTCANLIRNAGIAHVRIESCTLRVRVYVGC